MTRRRKKRDNASAAAELTRAFARGAVPADRSLQAPNNSHSPPEYYEDIAFTCRDCGREDVLSAEEQKSYYEVAEGSIDPRAIRCRDCRWKIVGRSFLVKIDRLVARHRSAEVQYLLATHPLTSHSDSPADELLSYAIEVGNARLASTCLEIGAKLDGDDTFPPIWYAVERADDDLSMPWFLLERNADPSIRMHNDLTPLHVAALENKLFAAAALISAGAEVDAETRTDQYFTPAMEASSRGHIVMLRLLLNAGANPRHKNRLGQSIVDVAGSRERREHIQKIVTDWKPKRRTT